MQQGLGAVRFFFAWSYPLGIAWAAWRSPAATWATALLLQLIFAWLERVPALQRSPAAAPMTGLHRAVLLGHVPLQMGLLALGLWLVANQPGLGWLGVVGLGIGIGAVTGSQGITFAHELGHSKRPLDRLCGWLLMASVSYAHFMVEHYRGHHPRAATHEDPASARLGETLWAFLPRTLLDSWRSAWRLEAQRLRSFQRGWAHSPLLWATLAQGLWLLLLGLWLGLPAVLLWIVQSVYAVFLLETVNYVEHYGLQRGHDASGRREPFAMHHAWNADHRWTNVLLVNLQRHSDHHMHAWKPYATLQPLPGPQLPTGYAGAVFIAMWPRWWFSLMHPRLAALGYAGAR
jgi:alkane 1-monooxygenase